MCCKIFLLCLFCFVCMLHNVEAQNTITFSLAAKKNNLTYLYCNQSRTNLKEYQKTVLENEPVAMVLRSKEKKDNTFINRIKCNEGKNNSVTIKKGSKTVLVGKIKNDWGGIWDCKVLFNQNNPQLQPKVTYNGISYTQVDCIIQLHVRVIKTPQLILVNGLELPTTRVSLDDTDQRFDHIAVYNYSSGDLVDVFCLNSNPDSGCNQIEMTYDYAEKLDGMFQRKWASETGVGFRTRLQAEHDGTYMVCRCTESNDVTTVKVTFILNHDIEDTGFCKINNLPVRRTMFTNSATHITSLENLMYRTLKDEKVNIVCDSIDNTKAVHETEQSSCQKIYGIDNSTTIDVLVYPKEFDEQRRRSIEKPSCDISYTLINSFNNNVLQYFKLKISDLPLKYKDNVQLTMNFPKENTFMEMYEHKDKTFIYYEYHDDDNITLTCSKYVQNPGPITYISFNGTDIYVNSSNIEIQLTKDHDNLEFNCSLMERMNSVESNTDKNIYRQSVIKFHWREPPTTTTTTMSTTSTSSEYGLLESSSDVANTKPLDVPDNQASFPDYLYVAVGAIIVCIVIACVTIVMCRMRRKPPRDQNTNIYENLANDPSHNEAIPPYPTQWTQENPYQVPIDQRNANDSTIYAEPVRPQEDAYATPLPKHLRPNKSYEPTYASLNLAPSDRSSQFTDRSQYATVGELYSQVLPKNARNPYDNVFPDSRYVNSDNTEYVEPTYSQAYMK